MKTILISGSNGFIANRFIELFSKDYNFICLSHNRSADHYTIEELTATPEVFKSVDIVLNLAGANIGAKYWTEARKQELLQSRVNSTSSLIAAFNRYNPQANFISASAVGIYTPEVRSNEETPLDYSHSNNFSQQLTRAWESAAEKYQGPLAITRIGVVLSHKGGAFQQMLRPFQFGFGGQLGKGSQYFPWIALPDLLSALKTIIDKKATGIYNLVAPQQINNKELSAEIARVWQRPNWVHLPEIMIKTVFGQMGKELLLNSIQVVPSRLLRENFYFKYPDITSCLTAIHQQKI